MQVLVRNRGCHNIQGEVMVHTSEGVTTRETEGGIEPNPTLFVSDGVTVTPAKPRVGDSWNLESKFRLGGGHSSGEHPRGAPIRWLATTRRGLVP